MCSVNGVEFLRGRIVYSTHMTTVHTVDVCTCASGGHCGQSLESWNVLLQSFGAMRPYETSSFDRNRSVDVWFDDRTFHVEITGFWLSKAFTGC